MIGVRKLGCAMKWLKRLCVVVCALSLLIPVAALAKKGGPPDDGGYGGGGGKSDEGVLYGDLYVMLRDDDGVPILDTNGCIQPVYIEDPDTDPLCRTVDMWDDIEKECALPEGAGDLVVSVETGRLSSSRTTDSVLDHAYAEAVKNIQNAVNVSTDPAFRLLLTMVDPDTLAEIQKTIDSPLENLAMYKKLMLNGFFPSITTVPMSEEDEAITYDPCLLGVGNFAKDFDWLCDDKLTVEDVESAVSFIGAAADKGGGIYLDMLININSNLGLNGPDVLAPVYFPFTEYDVGQNRYRYGTKDPVELLKGPYSLEEYPDAIWFQVLPSNIGSEVPFEDVLSCKEADVDYSGPSGPPSPADNFTQAADDARAVIEFLHNWSLPEYVIPEE